jgi:hypothetical protein
MHRLAFVALVLVFGSCQLLTGGDDFTFDPAAGGAGGQGAGGQGGGALPCEMDVDCPGTDATCFPRRCSEGSCSLEPAAADTPCRDGIGLVCDGAGECVECTTGSPCRAPEECVQGRCVPAECNNDELDRGETGIDCGGPLCIACDDGGGCDQGSDCQSGFCEEAGAGGAAGAAGAAPSGVCAPCGGDGDCDGAPVPSFCEKGTCVAKRPLADVCNAGPQCLSENCVDGVCCNTPCTGRCQACTNAKTGGPTGECHFIPNGVDPDDECGLLNCNGGGCCSVCL